LTRFLLVFLAIVVLVTLELALTGDPGRAVIVWRGYEITSTAAFAVIAIAVLSVLAVMFWRVAMFIAEQPRRAARARAEARRRQGLDALGRGFLALAAGEGPEARRAGSRAAELTDEAPALVRILAAQAAEAAGDLAAAQSAYTAMLGFPEMRLAGRRGLWSIATAQGDAAAALAHAEEANALAKTARWAWRALFEARVGSGAWSDALDLVEGALKRKILTPAAAGRARVALLAASAASLEASPDPKQRDDALSSALEAARLDPGFTPAVAIAARLLVEFGRPGRAEDFIEAAWARRPHPALQLAYRDLRMDETPGARSARLKSLAARSPDHRESRILEAEAALLVHDAPALRVAVERLADEPPTQRLCGLLARAAALDGRLDEARAWSARGHAAPAEADWSDLDPEGRAFAYSQGDWTRLVTLWAETGELAHPRFERRERMLSDLPDLPARWDASVPFVAEAAPVFAPLPDDPGPLPDAPSGPPANDPPPPPRPLRRRRAGGR
jgi:HemY protein